jgi:hypothetical protein
VKGVVVSSKRCCSHLDSWIRRGESCSDKRSTSHLPTPPHTTSSSLKTALTCFLQLKLHTKSHQTSPSVLGCQLLQQTHQSGILAFSSTFARSVHSFFLQYSWSHLWEGLQTANRIAIKSLPKMCNIERFRCLLTIANSSTFGVGVSTLSIANQLVSLSLQQGFANDSDSHLINDIKSLPKMVHGAR